MANSVGQFQLRRVLGLSAMGIPTLEGTNARLIVTGTFGESDVGRLAVCQAVTDQDEAPMMVVLGVVAEGAADTEGPLRLGRGKAVLELYDDGRVRLKGSNVVLDSTGALQMIAAQIDLN